MTALQQGQADGLCGLYAIANFLCGIPGGGWKPKETLVYLLESCAGHGWFTPRYIIDGYKDYQLRAILDDQICNHGLDYQTQLITDVVAAKNIDSIDDLIRRVIKVRGSIIGGPNNRPHWLLLNGFDGRGKVVDSADPRKSVYDFSGETKFSLHVGAGVVIVPRKRKSEEIDL